MLFGCSSRSKTLSTKRLPEAIALDSASKIIALGVRSNKSEDLSISEKIWVVVALNDFVAGIITSAPPLEDAWEDVSPMVQTGPMQGELARVPRVGTRGKEPVFEPVHGLGPSGSSLEVILEDGLKMVLL